MNQSTCTSSSLFVVEVLLQRKYLKKFLCSRQEEKSDFDFMDDASEPILRKSSRGGPKGSAKKKTTSFSGILSNMRRHRQQEQLEREQTALDSNKKS